jgi:hypothetical protein
LSQRGPGGQTTVLFALTLFLMAVMVILTLSISQRVSDRMELQTAADAAAYSEAVATARTLNSLAVLNRVEVGHTVSVMGTMAILSYVSLYWRHVDNVANLFLKEALIYLAGEGACCGGWIPLPCAHTCGSCKAGRTYHLNGYLHALLHSVLLRSWITSDYPKVYLADTAKRWNAANAIGAAPAGLETTLVANLRRELSATSFAVALASKTQSPQGPVTGANAGVNALSLGKLDDALYRPDVTRSGEPYLAASIANGSRGHPFISHRTHAEWMANLTVPWIVPYGVAKGKEQGSGNSYLGGLPPALPTATSVPPLDYEASDYGDQTVLFSGAPPFDCGPGVPPGVFGAGAYLAGVKGVSASYEGSKEMDTFVHDPFDNNPHAFSPPFPPFWDYNPTHLADAADLFGQPTQSVLMSRQYASAAPYVWDLHLDRGRFLSGTDSFETAAPPGIPLQQVAVGKGIVYYNRIDHSAEPPNLFAPYWRAGLSRMSVDWTPGSTDPSMLGVLNGIDPSYADEYSGLSKAGYAGFQ